MTPEFTERLLHVGVLYSPLHNHQQQPSQKEVAFYEK